MDVRQDEVIQLLRDRGIQPSAQRVAVAEYVLDSHEHPSADRVWGEVKRRLPMVSRATVYNTLNRLVREGLIRALVLAEGKVVFDPNLADHHHFIDESSGRIEDVPWQKLRVSGVSSLEGYEVGEYQVVMRGRRLEGPRP